MFTSVDKNRSTSLKRGDNCGKQLEKIRNVIRDLIMILTFRVTNVSKQRKTSNLLLLMRSRK
jgi:hypothetical protein